MPMELWVGSIRGEFVKFGLTFQKMNFARVYLGDPWLQGIYFIFLFKHNFSHNIYQLCALVIVLIL